MERTEKRCKENKTKMVEIRLMIIYFCYFPVFFAFMYISVNVGNHNLEAPQCALFVHRIHI